MTELLSLNIELERLDKMIEKLEQKREDILNKKDALEENLVVVV
ncbi:hypothetical protein [Niallia circulans]|nr:hypothetical protein [Niallia circulans]